VLVHVRRYKLESEFPSADPAFDFHSNQFDAARSLQHPTLLPPVIGENAQRPFDNLAKCRSILPSTHADAVKRTLTGPKQHAAAAKHGSKSTKLPKSAPTPHLFEQAAARYAEAGPLKVLSGYLRSQQKIRVIVRQRTRIRGWCTGQLKVRVLGWSLVAVFLRDMWMARGCLCLFVISVLPGLRQAHEFVPRRRL